MQTSLPEGSKTRTALAPMSATIQCPEVGLTATETGSFSSRWLKLVTTSPSRVISASCLERYREIFLICCKYLKPRSPICFKYLKPCSPICCKYLNLVLQFANISNLVLQFANISNRVLQFASNIFRKNLVLQFANS